MSLRIKFSQINCAKWAANLFAAGFVLATNMAHAIPGVPAAGGGQAWDTSLCRVANMISGPTAAILLVIVTIFTGIMFLLGESKGFMKIILGIIFAGSLALSSVSVATWVFPSLAAKLACTVA